MEEFIESEKLENLLNQMKQVPVLTGSNTINMSMKSAMPKGYNASQGENM